MSAPAPNDLFGAGDPTNALPKDELGEALVKHGLVPNDFILDLNNGLTVPHDMEMPPPWNLLSRMFQFPVETTSSRDKLPRRIGLVHPLLAEHPFVLLVQEKLGLALDPNGAANDFGFSKKRLATWWHAVDLVSAGMWRELLRTERFTTPGDIAGAVSFGLTYPGEKGKARLTTHDARKIMAHLQIAEPDDKPALLRHFLRPSFLKQEKGAERWPINSGAGAASEIAWAHIAGIENGWFSPDRGGFLNWAPKGRDKFSAVVGAKPPEPIQADDASPTIVPPAKPPAKTHTQRLKESRKPTHLTLF